MASKVKSNGGIKQCEKKLSPMYNFFLNPYLDRRFTSSCPGCSGKTRQRKLPLAIHVADWGILILNKTCRFCPDCELLIAHQNELDEVVTPLQRKPASSKDALNYFVVGTLERRAWRRGVTKSLSKSEMLGALHEFKDYLSFKSVPRWEYTGLPDHLG